MSFKRSVVLGAIVLLGCTSSGTPPKPPPFVEVEAPGPEGLTVDEPRALTPPAQLARAISLSSRASLMRPLGPSVLPTVVVGDGSNASIAEVQSVTLSAALAEVSGPHELVLELLTPGQSTYERRTVQVDPAAGSTQTVDFEIPVAGTNITTFNLAGTWNARFFVDGRATASIDFELAP